MVTRNSIYLLPLNLLKPTEEEKKGKKEKNATQSNKSIWHPVCRESFYEIPVSYSPRGRMMGAPYFGAEET